MSLYRKTAATGFFSPSAPAFILIFIIGLSIYANILHAPAQIDDHDLLFGNPLIKDLSEFCRRWYVDYRQKALTLFTFAVNYYFGKENTFGYHLVNVLLHILTTFFFFSFLRDLLTTPELSKSPIVKERNTFALIAALIFLVHPLQTESVAYMWQRSEVLSGLFYMAALWCWLKRRLGGPRHYYVSMLFLYIVGFFAKGIIVTLPLMILLIEISFFRFEKIHQGFTKNWPVFTLGVVGILFFLQKKYAMLMLIDLFMEGSLHMQVEPNYILTQYRVMWKYIGLALAPFNQNADPDVLLSSSLMEPATFFSMLALIALAATVFLIFKGHRLISAGVLWFFIYLLPTSVVLRDPMWEHRLYFSLAGFAVVLTTVIFTFSPNPKVRTTIAVCIICLFSVLTVKRNTLWRSPKLLLEDTVAKSPYKARPRHMLGTVYLHENLVEKALQQFQAAIYLDPHYADPYNNIGLILYQRGDLARARNYFERAIALRPALESPYINLGYIVLYSQHDHAGAENLFKKSLGYKESVEGYVALGNLYLETKDYQAAVAAFIKAQEISYNNPVVFYSLGNAYYHQNDFPKALVMYNKTIELDGAFTDAHYNTGMIYFQTKKFDLARSWIEKAAQLNPRRQDICHNLVRINEAMQDTKRAEEIRQRCQSLASQ